MDDEQRRRHEVDYRFTLANERTFLSWVRTAIALLAGGVAVHTLAHSFQHAFIRQMITATCLVLAVAAATGGYAHWRNVGARMTRGEPLTGSLLVPVMATGVTAITVLTLIAIFVE